MRDNTEEAIQKRVNKNPHDISRINLPSVEFQDKLFRPKKY
jgi:hypothetical protein